MLPGTLVSCQKKPGKILTQCLEVVAATAESDVTVRPDQHEACRMNLVEGMNSTIRVKQGVGKGRTLVVNDEKCVHNLRVQASQQLAMLIKIDRIPSRVPGEKQQLVHRFTQPVEQKNGFI